MRQEAIEFVRNTAGMYRQQLKLHGSRDVAQEAKFLQLWETLLEMVDPDDQLPFSEVPLEKKP